MSLLRLGFKKNGSFCLAHLTSPALDLPLALVEAYTVVSSVVRRPTWQGAHGQDPAVLCSPVNNLMSELGGDFPSQALR